MISEGPLYRGGNIVNYELKLSQGIEVWSLILKTLPFVRTEMLEESGVPSVIKLSEAQERSLLSNCNVDDVLLSRPTHPFLLKLFRKPYNPSNVWKYSFQIYVPSLKDTLKGRVAALKLAKLSNVLFMQLPNFTTESIKRNLFS